VIKGDAKQLNRLLSFAVGGLLGDVFLHLLPEAWGHVASLKGKNVYLVYFQIDMTNCCVTYFKTVLICATISTAQYVHAQPFCQ